MIRPLYVFQALLVCPLLAQEDTSIFDLDLDELINQPVTIASRQSEIAAEAPSSVTVFTRKEIQAMGILTLDELINYVPGFQAFRDIESGQNTNIHARGRRDINSRGVLVLIDGLRMNDALSGGATLLNRLMTIENIAQIEIIRGPGSALYGANAFTGVINIITEKDSNQIKLQAGPNNAGDANVHLSGKGNDWQASLFARGFLDKGHTYHNIYDRFGIHDRTEDPREGGDLYLSLKKKAFRLDFNHQRRHLRDFYAFGYVANGVNRVESYRHHFHLTFEETYDAFEVKVGASNAEATWNPLVRLAPKGVGPFIEQDFIAQPYVEQEHRTFYTDLTYTFNEKHKLFFGGVGEHQDLPVVIGKGNYDLETLEFYGAHVDQAQYISITHQDIWGAYLQSQHHFGDKWNLTLGMRHDNYSRVGGTTNPRAALVYKNKRMGNFKFMYGQSFRAPTIGELYIVISPVDWGNPDLKPERIKTFEAAHVKMWTHAQTTVTVFHTKLTDAVLQIPTFTPEAGGTRLIARNVARETFQGIEFEFNGSPRPGVLMRGNLSYIARGVTDFTPKIFGGLIFNWQKDGFHLNLNAHYHGNIQGFEDQDAYTLTNGRFGYALKENLEFFISGTNIFNASYFTPGVGGFDVGPNPPRNIPARGRQLMLGFKWQWE